jgi:hypothetical protein
MEYGFRNKRPDTNAEFTDMVQMQAEIERLHDLLGKANALARIRWGEIEQLKAAIARQKESLTDHIETNIQLRKEIERLKAEPEPLYRSDEEAVARKELREQLMDAAGRTDDDVVIARLTRMAEELK